MDNDKKNEKVLLRKNLICYFLAMAKGQQGLQQLQDELVMHPYFNPILIFKKISKGHMVLTQSNFKQYMIEKIGITSAVEMEAYFKKHDLDYIIECEQFIGAMLPYTPDILRNSQATIVWQVRSSPTLKKDIEQLFKSAIKAQISSIVNVASFRKKIGANWEQIKTLIKKDLKKNGTILENRYMESEIDMMMVRRWIELWIEINEKDVLDMIRWMSGDTEAYIKKYFNNLVLLNLGNCNCEKPHEYPIKLRNSVKKYDYEPLRSASLRRLSRKELEMYQRKISYRGLADQKPIKNLQTIHSSKSFKTLQRKASIADQLFKAPKTLHKKVYQRSISLWCQYVHTILSGQKILANKRSYLKPELERVVEILQSSVISKKKQVTKITKLINFVEKHIQLPSTLKKHFEKYLSNLSMSNEVIISIFHSGLSQKNIATNKSIQNQVKGSQDLNTLKIQLAQILQNYFLTKSRLIQISKQLIKYKLHQNLYNILNPSNSKNIAKESLSQILNEMQIDFNEEDIQILLKHFGDGEKITEQSFFRVFEIQGN